MDKSTRTIDAYIAQFPKHVQERLQELRRIILKAAPGATEDIKYLMPTIVLNGNLIHFAAFKKHIGFFPAPTGVTSFEKELAPYKGTKLSMHLHYDKPLPASLITRIVKHRIKEMEEERKAAAKKKSEKDSVKKVAKVCPKGHKFYKTSDCPTCPVCAKEQEIRVPKGGEFLLDLAAPARNTLLHHNINTIKKLAQYTEKEILALHGMGKASLPKLREALEKAGLSFKP